MEELSSYERFSELLGGSHTQLFGYLYALVQDIHDAEDLYQTTSVVLWRKFDSYREGSNFFQWAKTVAHYQALNLLRSRKHRRAVFSESFCEELAVVWGEVGAERWESRRKALSACLTKLPENDRKLVEACYGTSQSLCDTAKDLGRAPKGVYDALARIRRLLLRCIEASLAKEGV
jgi:RNA polymerase sigma-70 factor (ECF subfamily)